MNRVAKKKYVNEIKPGEMIEEIFVLSQKTLSQKRDGGNFLNVVLSDRTGDLKGVVWDNVLQIAADNSSGDYVSVKGTVSEYRGTHQIVVREMVPLAQGQVQPADFLPATRQDVDNMLKRLRRVITTVATGPIKTLLEAFFEDETFVQKFKTAPAAKKMHHAFIGGLLEHTLSMALLTERIAPHYIGIDRDLLMAGAILHDIGKIEELQYQHMFDYSDEGRLLSHIVIGVRLIEQKIETISDFPSQQAMLLKHLIVSHHGSREFGSPEVPKTLEAVLLHHIDEIDSKINAIRDFMAADDGGEAWTGYHRLLERHFYKGTPPGNENSTGKA